MSMQTLDLVVPTDNSAVASGEQALSLIHI